MKWQKVFHQDKKNLKSEDLSKCTEVLKEFVLVMGVPVRYGKMHF
jgi:hypothetical protein